MRVQALVAAGVIVLFAGLIGFAYYATLPYAGFEFAGPAQIGAVVPGSPAEAAGLRIGDEVLAVDGVPFTQVRAYLRPGQKTLPLTVSRNQDILQVEINLVSPSLKERFITSGHLLVALAFWLVAMAVLAFKPRDAMAQHFVLITLLGVLALILWLLADLGLAWANMLMAVVVVSIGPLFVHFHTLFPERGRFRGRDLLVASLYVIGLVLMLASIASDLAYYLQLGPEEKLSSLPTTAAIEAFFSLCLLIGIVLLVRARLITESETSRRRANIILAGTVLALLPFLTLIVLPQALSAPYLVPTWLTLMALIFIPASYVYAIFRHDLTGWDKTINRTVVFYLVALILTSLYLLFTLGLRRMMPQASTQALTLTDAGLFIGLVLVANPLKQRAQIAVDHVLYGGWYNYQSFISHTSKALGDAEDVDGICLLLEECMVGTMHFRSLALLLPDPSNAELLVRGQVGFDGLPEVGPGSEVPQVLLSERRPADHAALYGQFPAESATRQALDQWTAAGVQTWLPLVQQDELMGLLLLGGKQADDFVTHGDLDILDTLGQQVAVAIHRLRLIDDLQHQMQEVRAMGRQILALQERNQHRLSRELHDLVLQRLVVAKNSLEQTQQVWQPDKIDQAHGTLLELTVYVRSIMFELRSPNWDDTDLPTALEDYCLTFEDRQGLPVIFQARGQDPGAPMPDEVRTAIYRILQESLNNVWKHAQAHQVEVNLALRAGAAHLEVRDDGVGFEAAVHLAGLVGKGKLGLVTMRERAAEVGGRCDIKSAPGEGTRVLVQIPLS